MTPRAAQSVIGFAHRGAPRAAAEENTLPAFERALVLGARGLESDIGLTADGVPVLIHSGLTLRRRTPISQLYRRELPLDVPSLEDLYRWCGTDFDLSLDMAAPEAADAVVLLARRFAALDRLWLTYWRLPTVRIWRERWPDVRLVYPTMPVFPGSVARLLPTLSALGVDALNVHHRLCTAGLTRAAHAHGLLLFAWGVRNGGMLPRVLRLGIDGVYCDDVESMVEAFQDSTAGPSSLPMP